MGRKSWLAGVVLSVLIHLEGPAAFAAVRPHALISDGMVLQQGMNVPIWGWADEGEKVTVRIQDQAVTATAKDGKWMVRLENLKPGGPFEMSIRGENTLEFKNVFVGEVWICSGQSNMEWPVRASADAEKTIASSRNPLLRLFTVPHNAVSLPTQTVVGRWQECGPETVPNFSAVAYFFGRVVQKARNVPVGLIHTSWGGTPAESWTSAAALAAEPVLKHLAGRAARDLADYPKKIEKYIADLKKYQEALSKALAEKREPSAPPALPPFPGRNPWTPSALYNGMIASIIPYGMRGAIWYQGESNADRAYEYRTLLPAMIKNWREDWGEGNFPFLIVQLAPFMKIEAEPKESQWAELREAQLWTTLRVPNTALAVITDVGHETDIHPKWKEPVGARLARAARALAYGEKIVYSGPVYSEMKIEGNQAILSFQHVGRGLVAKGGPLVGFTIAGPDHKFVKALAEIREDKVVVWSPDVKQPVAVRYGWANYPVVNLWNQEGLPASPFRTDDFPLLTQPKTRPSATNLQSR
jgi:sialate O-acetylesterase